MRALLATLIVLFLALVGLASPLMITTDRIDFAIRGVSLMAADQGQFQITSPLKLQGLDDIVVESGTVSLAKTEAAASSNSGKAILATLERGDSRLLLEDAVVVVKSARPTGGLTTALGSLEAPFAEVLSRLLFKSITLKGATLKIEAGDGTADILTNIDAMVSLVGVKRVKAAGSFEFRGQQLSFSVSLDASRRGQTDGQLPFRASLKGELMEAAFDGHLIPGNGGRLLAPKANINIQDLPRAARWLGLAWPETSPVHVFSASGALDWYGRALAFQDAVIRFDADKATGTLSLNYNNNARPKIDGTLAFGSLDLTKYVAAAKGRGDLGVLATTVLQSAHWLPGTLGQGLGGFARPLVQQLDADVRLSADTIIVGGQTVGRGAATLSVLNGVLIADLPELDLASGGSGSLQVTADTTGVQPHYGLRGKTEAVEISHLMTLMTGTTAIAGRGDVTFDLTATGSDAAGILASLAGKFSVEAPDQIRVGADFSKLSQRRDEAAGEPGWGTAAEAPTLLHSGRINGTLEAGVAQIVACRAQAGQRQFVATGSADLGRHAVDLQLWMDDEPNGTSGMQKGTLIRIMGPWAKPNISTAAYPSRAASPIPADRSTAPPRRTAPPGRS